MAALIGASSAGIAAPVLAPRAEPGPVVQPYVRINAAQVVLRHVRVIDGTGAPAQADRTIILTGEKISAIGPADLPAPPGSTVLDLPGYTVLPGIVGMHDHIFYIATPNMDASGQSEQPVVAPQMTFSAPRLYLANGVTTIRTTGSVEPYIDLNLKTGIDAGTLPGPHMDVTGPYLEGVGSRFLTMRYLKDTAEVRKMVAFWADQGVNSFKAYERLTRAQLKVAIEEVHRRGLKITGHLCAVTYPEAAELGIDNLEHSFYVNTQLDPDKVPDICPKTRGRPTMLAMTPESPEAEALIRLLVDRRVALTSTLSEYEQSVPGHPPLRPKALSMLAPQAREAHLYHRDRRNSLPPATAEDMRKSLQNLMGLERKFVAAGGLLIAGCDPTGNGGIVPGFADHRQIELLVEAGFAPEEAIKIATLNGATYLGLADRIGSIAVGKNADLMVVKGDPSRNIVDIGNVEIVFKDGIGYDSERLLNSVRGRYGQY